VRKFWGGVRKGLEATHRSFFLSFLAVLLSVGCLTLFPLTRGAVSSPAAWADDERTSTPDAQIIGEASAPPRRAELLERLGVPAWQARGWRGQGLKIAVLDSGFQGYRAHLGTTLPANVKVRSFRFDGNLEAKDSQHGILCAEVIHTLAPEAELLLANWEPERPHQFLAAVRWAREEGARILSCSIIMPTWSDCAGHGRIHEELARLLGPCDRSGDALFFASAGNTALRHWSGPFEDDGAGHHVWRGSDGFLYRENAVRPWGGERVSVELCCPAGAVFEVIVRDATVQQIVGCSRSTEAGGFGCGVVAFAPAAGHDYRVRVRRLAAPLPHSPAGRGARGGGQDFHLVVLGGGLRYSSPAGSIAFPGDGAEVVAVGAVDAVGRRLAYSSCGSTRGGVKPDLVARVPFPSGWRARPFAGTSAAAPQASALAALLWSRHTDWNAEQVRAALRNAARPCSEKSPTWETGHGLLRLPAANPQRSASRSP
jgi:subtilisin family serine protease